MGKKRTAGQQTLSTTCFKSIIHMHETIAMRYYAMYTASHVTWPHKPEDGADPLSLLRIRVSSGTWGLVN
jgi:hypothetical protein